MIMLIKVNRLFVSVHDRYNWINHESSENDRNKNKQWSHTECSTAKNCCFLELYTLLFVTDMLEGKKIIFWNWYVAYKVLSLIESGNFRYKPTWQVHTMQASIERVTFKMAAGGHQI